MVEARATITVRYLEFNYACEDVGWRFMSPGTKFGVFLQTTRPNSGNHMGDCGGYEILGLIGRGRMMLEKATKLQTI